MLKFLEELAAIAALLVVVVVILRGLPKIELGHRKEFLRRRTWNWIPLGLTYSFLYMARYNINVGKNHGLMTKEQLGTITFWGMLTYGIAFVINGPITDRFGGRKTIIVAALGSGAASLLIGFFVWSGIGASAEVGALSAQGVVMFSVLYAVNMYFQSFGAVSIVKVNSQWFHVLERGVLGGVFGILISLGVYFAFDGSRLIAEVVPLAWMFFIPAIILFLFAALDYKLVFDKPGDTGHEDFDVADASSDESDEALSVWQVAKKMATNPVVLTIAFIELCSGFVRNGIMKWTYVFLKETGQSEIVAYKHWGMILCIAGITGGVFAGAISDKVFQSRRGPSAAILYLLLALALAGAALLITSPYVAYILVFTILCIIGVHGMLSGTAAADFGGRKNAGIAVGLIDGMVYLGSACQAILFGNILPKGAEQKIAANWASSWLWIIFPVSLAGLLLSVRIWHAKPKAAKAASERLAAVSRQSAASKAKASAVGGQG